MRDIEECRGLVQHESGSFLGEGSGDPHALPFSAGESIGVASGERSYARLFQRVADGCVIALACCAPKPKVRIAAEGNVIPYLRGKCCLLALRDYSDAPREFGGRQCPDVTPPYGN